jgi:ABC-type sugar transport system substrate-binding protein
MKKIFLFLLSLLVLGVVMVGCGKQTTDEGEESKEVTDAADVTDETDTTDTTNDTSGEMKIAYGVPAINNGFHQAQANWATKYAEEKYGAKVEVFDGKSDADTINQNFREMVIKGFDMVTIQPWKGEDIKTDAEEAIQNGMIITTFYGDIPGVAVPQVTSAEADVSEEMGKIAAEQWKKANPDKPIKFVSIGWPDNESVKTGRTDPFAKGVLSVDPNAIDLGCKDGSKGADAAKKIIQDLLVSDPDINIIYSEAGDLTVGVLPALEEAGRGKMDNGVPITEILCSVDCPQNELISCFDPNSSLKMSMGIPPKEVAYAKIDALFDIKDGKIQKDDASLIYVPNKLIGYWSQNDAKEAFDWYNEQFEADVKIPDYGK